MVGRAQSLFILSTVRSTAHHSLFEFCSFLLLYRPQFLPLQKILQPFFLHLKAFPHTQTLHTDDKRKALVSRQTLNKLVTNNTITHNHSFSDNAGGLVTSMPITRMPYMWT